MQALHRPILSRLPTPARLLPHPPRPATPPPAEQLPSGKRDSGTSFETYLKSLHLQHAVVLTLQMPHVLHVLDWLLNAVS